MPELPDVEAFRERLKKEALRKPVHSTTVHDHRMLEDLSASTLGRRLKSRSFTSAHRHGKILFLRQSRGGGALVLRFGMTGSVQVCPKNEDAPEHTRAELQFSNGSRLAIISQRLLGHIGFTADEQQFIEKQHLGPDALNDEMAEKNFTDLLAESRATIKATLMDQSRIAGIGNVYADEILFQAAIRPDRKAGALSKKESLRIRRKIRHVLKTAADRLAKGNDLPKSWLLPQRGKTNPCPRCDKKIKSMKVSGRTAWYCPHCQK